MKPLLIKLRNIGPFVNEQIDFSKLENMFLITGNIFYSIIFREDFSHKIVLLHLSDNKG